MEEYGHTWSADNQTNSGNGPTPPSGPEYTHIGNSNGGSSGIDSSTTNYDPSTGVVEFNVSGSGVLTVDSDTLYVDNGNYSDGNHSDNNHSDININHSDNNDFSDNDSNNNNNIDRDISHSDKSKSKYEIEFTKAKEDIEKKSHQKQYTKIDLIKKTNWWSK